MYCFFETIVGVRRLFMFHKLRSVSSFLFADFLLCTVSDTALLCPGLLYQLFDIFHFKEKHVSFQNILKSANENRKPFETFIGTCFSIKQLLICTFPVMFLANLGVTSAKTFLCFIFYTISIDCRK